MKENKKFACGSVLFFEDGTTGENVYHIGTEEECKQVMNSISAVSYSGDKKVKEAQIVIVPIEEKGVPDERRED